MTHNIDENERVMLSNDNVYSWRSSSNNLELKNRRTNQRTPPRCSGEEMSTSAAVWNGPKGQ